MNKYILLLFTLFLVGFGAFAQQLNCNVVVNAEQTGRSNMTVFKTLENSIKSFMNETNWIEQSYDANKRLECNIYINITSFEGNNFAGTIQVQSSRPVFNSTYNTPVFNYNDEQFSFTYTEHQPLRFDRNTFESNLISTLAFYAYTFLGMDADTFALEGGDPFFKEASQIVGTAQQGRASGWRPTDGSKSRYRLNTDLLSNAFIGFRQAMYNYHRLGLDQMAINAEEAKTNIVGAVENLNEMNKRRSNSLLLRVFFDAKAAEIEKIFSGGPTVPVTDVLETLNRIAPSYSDNWKNISY